jgi:hypothetical protein
MRVTDLPRLLLLQSPVRCHICLHRRFANLFSAILIKQKKDGPSHRAAAK